MKNVFSEILNGDNGVIMLSVQPSSFFLLYRAINVWNTTRKKNKTFDFRWNTNKTSWYTYLRVTLYIAFIIIIFLLPGYTAPHPTGAYGGILPTPLPYPGAKTYPEKKKLSPSPPLPTSLYPFCVLHPPTADGRKTRQNSLNDRAVPPRICIYF